MNRDEVERKTGRKKNLGLSYSLLRAFFLRLVPPLLWL